MQHHFHNFSELFAQLGLGSSPEEIERFLYQHAPLAGDVALPDAPFWSPTQAAFLREALAEDGDWSEVVDMLNVALRQDLPIANRA
ncbi:MAG: DUF2789 domain-containing protein [Gammaproteobacteria bacterium]|nr:DUF2789 domain-containing protein [Gammaproteobacteria bacterium]